MGVEAPVHLRPESSRGVPPSAGDLRPRVRRTAAALETRGVLDLAKGGPEMLLWWFGLLRDAMTAGATVRWVGQWDDSVNVARLVHLLPPAPRLAGRATTLLSPGEAAWRDEYRYGLCYYRLGLDFVQVKDMRRPDDRANYVLFEPAWIGVFLQCLTPTPADAFTGAKAEAAEGLEDPHLLYRAGRSLVTLPYRMRRWPIPYDAV